MNEKNKLLVALGVIVAVLIGSIVIGISASANKVDAGAILEQVREAKASEEGKLVYVMSKKCSWCALYKDEIDYIKKDYPFEYLQVDTEKFTQAQIEELSTILEIEKYGTPYMTYVKNGEVVKELEAYNTASALFTYLQEIEFISKEEKLPVTYIDYKKYTELLNGKEKSVIVIGQSGCGYCTKAVPMLDKIVEENNITINYFDYKTITNQEDYTGFFNSLPYFTAEKWGTPLMIVVQNGQLVKALPNPNSKEGFVSFLKEVGIIK